MMSTRKRCHLFPFCFYANVILLFYFASAYTDPLDVKSLEDLYGLLNQPTMLTGWMATGGDPCGQNWTGVSCSGSSIMSIKINGLGLGGTVSSQLSSFLSLTQLDMSYNNFSGEMPSGLPPSATSINFAVNKIAGNIPMSLSSLKNLKYLNLSNNNLFGVVSNAFTDMTSVEILDLSFNSFSGDLPSSFGSLKNLHSLYLQHNQFTGSVNFFANLPLTNLNIENNNFRGYVPKQFELIPELRIEGNKFEPYFLNRTRKVYPSFSPKFTYPKQIRSPMIVALVATTTFIIVYGMMTHTTATPPTPPPMPRHLPYRQARQRAPVSTPTPTPPPPPPLPLPEPIRAAPSSGELTFQVVFGVLVYLTAILAGCYMMIVYIPPNLPKASAFRRICVRLGDFILYSDALVQVIWLILLLAGKMRANIRFVLLSCASFLILLALGACFKTTIILVSDVTTSA